MPFLLQVQLNSLQPSRLLRLAALAQHFDAADLDKRAWLPGRGAAPDRDLVPQMFGEALRWESLRLQVGDRLTGPTVDQNVPAILLIDAAAHCGLLDSLLLRTTLLRGGREQRRPEEGAQEPNRRCMQALHPGCVPYPQSTSSANRY